MREGELFMAFLDVLCVVSPTRPHSGVPQHLGERVVATCEDSSESGQAPARIEALQAAAERVDPDATVRRGDPHSGLSERRITILGTQVGTREFVLEQLESKVGEHATFSSIIPAIQDLQCAWFLLLYCGVARANFFLGTISPDLSLDFATRHDNQIWDCFCSLWALIPRRCSGPHTRRRPYLWQLAVWAFAARSS